MRLKSIILENFRCYQQQIKIDIDEDLTAIIGRNDVGKSTILEALEIFFNNKTVKIEPDDLCVYGENDTVLIGCIFDEYPNEIIIDASSKTTLASSYLLNEHQYLQIFKRFKCNSKNPKEQVSILANHPSLDSYNDLLFLKNSELKSRMQKLGVAQVDVDLRSNVSLREAIWNSCDDLQLRNTEILLNKEDAKIIWDKLSSYLPTFALFQSDRGSKDDDSEVQDPMKIAVQNAVKAVEQQLTDVKNQVQKMATEVAIRTLGKLREMDSTLADTLQPNFKSEPKWDSLFKLTLSGDDDIPVNKRGSGVRRLILLNFFRAEAERKQDEQNSPNIIYAIEEPETSQHPNNQELLIKSLLELSKTDNCQVLLTTHVPALAGLLPLESIRFVASDNNRKLSVTSGNESVYSQVAESLGVLPEKAISTAKALIMVEGVSDTVFLEHASVVLKIDGHVSHSLEEKGIVPIITGGCGNLKHWVNLSTLKKLNKPYGVFLDSDEGSENVRQITETKNMIQTLSESGIPAFRTRKREAENYLHPNIFLRTHGVEIAIEDFSDVKVEVNNKLKSISKGEVLKTFWPHITSNEILERDIYIDDDGNQRHEILEIVNIFLALA